MQGIGSFIFGLHNDRASTFQASVDGANREELAFRGSSCDSVSRARPLHTLGMGARRTLLSIFTE
jgi:hypothetical protein